LNAIGLHANSSNPCLYTGHIVNPSTPDATHASSLLTLGLYVDDFVYFSDDPYVERLFERLLSSLVTVDFMGTVEWFLGTHFQWHKTDDEVSVHLSQTGFAAHLVEDNNAHLRKTAPDATPYRSGLPINAIPESDKADDCPTFIERKQKYQSIVGSIGWLASSTRPNLVAIHSFLLAYNNKPSRSHWNVALYILHYIHSTINYGISFTLRQSPALHSYMSYPHKSDTEAYTDTFPPNTDSHHRLSTYSDACWGSQLGNAVREGLQLPLFKFRSMNGAIVMRSGGPISWKAERQDRTSLSLCEAEIHATNTGLRLTVNMRNMISSLLSLGYPIRDADSLTPLYNDNNACVKWCHNMTTKGNRHIENWENSVCEWVADGTLTVLYVCGKSNIADIFTKEMRDAANFCRLRDAFMSRESVFIKCFHSLHNVPPLPTAQTVHYVAPSHPGLLEVLASHVSFHLPNAISSLSASGRYLLSRITSSFPLQALMSDTMEGVVK
jgi:hypothetical protein